MNIPAMLTLASAMLTLGACASASTPDSAPPSQVAVSPNSSSSPTALSSSPTLDLSGTGAQESAADNLQVDLVSAASEEAALQGVVQRGRPSEPVRSGDWATMDFSTESDGLKVLFGLVDGKWAVVDAGTFEVGCPFVTAAQARELNLLCP